MIGGVTITVIVTMNLVILAINTYHMFLWRRLTRALAEIAFMALRQRHVPMIQIAALMAVLSDEFVERTIEQVRARRPW